MLKLMVLSLAAVVLLPQTAGSLPSFAGRWRLADATQPRGAALELFVTEDPARPSLRILRQLERGVARLTIFFRTSGAERRAGDEGQSITGLPYLYPLVATEDGTRFVAHAQSPALLGNGSAARFDDVGVYVFATEGEARAFADTWRGRAR